MTGMGYYFGKYALIGLMRLVGAIVRFSLRAVYWSFQLLGRGANAFYNMLANAPQQPPLEDDDEMGNERI